MRHAMHRRRLVRVPLALLLLAAGGTGAGAQLRPSYDHGQWVSPAFEGWVENEDGTIDILFGHMNRNWLEELHVPIGPENRFLGEKADLGQPTRFLPRRNRFVFRVRAPEGLTEDDELVWELATRGKTQRAYASIRPDFKLNNVAIMSETGSLGAGTSAAATRANISPSIRLEGGAERTVRVGEPLGLVAVVTDDGVPERSERADGPPEDATPEERLARAMRAPVRVTVAKTNALHMTWFPYRGRGSVEFEPPQVKPWEDTRPFQNSPWSPMWVAPEEPEDGRWVATATFLEPGDYLLRGRADDGGLFTDVEVRVRVQPPDVQ